MAVKTGYGFQFCRVIDMREQPLCEHSLPAVPIGMGKSECRVGAVSGIHARYIDSFFGAFPGHTVTPFVKIASVGIEHIIFGIGAALDLSQTAIHNDGHPIFRFSPSFCCKAVVN